MHFPALRTMAGSDSESPYLIQRLNEFIDAQKALNPLSGEWLTVEEQREALRLPDAELSSSEDDEYEYRRWLCDHAMDVIVQGALRLAAHKLLAERPHFGGKYSEQVIQDGIRLFDELRRPASKPKRQATATKKAKAAKWDDAYLGAPEQSSSGRRKPWSSRDSRSWRDPKPDDEK